MGFTYLDDKRWCQITREERFFCQRLYELINRESPERFIKYLHDNYALDLPVDGEWEIGFEVCFYRDLWKHSGKKGQLFSPKRTFDLCLFGERAIVIIEAKAATGFDTDQNEIFSKDADEVKRLTDVDKVMLMGICSSKYKPEADLTAMFTGPIVTWKELAQRFDNDEILLRADNVYEFNYDFSNFGNNSDSRKNGTELVEAFHNGSKWWVGRKGNIQGTLFTEDVSTGRWRTHRYEVNTTASEPPSSNYFSLREFVRVVEASINTHP